MLRSKSRVARYAALVAGASLVLASCGGGGGDGDGEGTTGQSFADCDANPNTCNSASPEEMQDGGDITFAMEKNVENWNITSSEGNVLDTAMAIKTVLPYTFYTKPDFTPALNEDVLESAEMTSEDPQVIEYKINPDAQWDDGTPISADDFIYNWKVLNGEDCPDCAPASTGGYDRVESVEGSDDGKTVTVTFAEPYTDWKSMWSSDNPLYPAHIAAEQGDLDTPEGLAKAFEWFGQNVPDYSGSAYKIADWQNNEALTLEPNENFWGQQPKLDRLVFRVITDATQEPTALQNGEVDVIYPQPQVDLVNQIRNIPNVSSHIGQGLTWEHFDFNLRNEFLAEEPLRDALFTAIDRQGLIDKTVGQFTDGVEPLNSHMFVPQQEGYTDVVTEHGHGTGDVEAAKKILTDAGYTLEGGQLKTPEGENVAPMRIRYTVGNQIRKDQSELFANAARELGVTVNVEPTDDLGGTLTEGDYDIMVFAWVGNPFPYGSALQLWHSESDSNYGGYENADVDRLLSEAAAETDVQAANEKLNEANRIMAEDAYVLPLYQKPTFLAAYDNVANLRGNSTLDSPTYNAKEWGLRAE
ncbi:ABC transporter family substrate-binding protein [Saccharomonospora saliphila]|uniref:ABC transporter family substrate-binding protein n=1 Tax=Saccharomonospora saliphila TaxID=369829 RepID=UPI0004918B63|nr:ABC transporter family substrate-binding protein [Saccharomonospora saliphila]